MLTIEKIQERLRDMNLKRVAEASGLAHDTVWQIARGKRENVSYNTLRKLSEYFEKREAR